MQRIQTWSVVALVPVLIAIAASETWAKTEEEKAKIPLILNATPVGGELVIQGASLVDVDSAVVGAPVVTLNGETLEVIDYSEYQLRAVLPDPLFEDGTYLLTVAYGPEAKEAGIFGLTVGTITEVAAGPGLTGGGARDGISLQVEFGGSGSAGTASRSDHVHDGFDITSGTVQEERIDQALARDAEILQTVKDQDGPGSGIDADLLDGLQASDFLQTGAAWSLGGNAGTVPGTHFLGTMDSQPLELRVANSPVMRFDLSGNVIGGFVENGVSSGQRGAVIGGGGTLGRANQVLGSYGTVAGGRGNIASTLGSVGGGENNKTGGMHNVIAGGHNNETSGHPGSTVGGGLENRATDHSATVGGGARNVAGAIAATVSGGQDNSASYWGTVPGGKDNQASSFSFAAGRRAKAVHGGSFVWADATDADFGTTNSYQFLIRAGGGVGIGTNRPSEQLEVAGNVKASSFFGDGSALTGVTADLFDGLDSSDFMPASADRWVDVAGDVMTGPLVIGGAALHSTPGEFHWTVNGGEYRWRRDNATLYSDSFSLEHRGSGNLAISSVRGKLLLGAPGGVGIGTTAPTEMLEVGGNVKAESFIGDGSGLRNVLPAGIILPFAGTTPPEGFLLCDGSVLSAAEYPELFAAISTSWGGDGSTFRLPDLMGRTLVGAGTGAGLSPRPLAQQGGVERHSLTTDEMPSHGHGVNDPKHQHSAVVETGDDTGGNLGDGGKGGARYYRTTFSATNVSIQSTGGSQAHENMPPFAAVSFIIKY